MNCSPTKIAVSAYSQASEVFEVVSNPIVIHIMNLLERRRNLLALDLTSGEYKVPLILKYLRRMEAIGLVRKDKLGREISYILNHDRLDTINAAAARLL
jgi:predicted MarR family transcription regulator